MSTKGFVIGILLLFACSDSFAINSDIPAGGKDAFEILEEVSKILSLEDIRSEQVLSVARKDATIRQYRLKIMTSGKDKAFVEIIEPKQFRGRQFLRLGDDTVWAYFPELSLRPEADRRVKTAIRVSGRADFMGGDFSNNDVLRMNLLDDYAPKIIEDLTEQYVLELNSKDLNVTYAKIILWVRKGDFQPIRLECYSLGDELIKSVLYQDYRDYGEGFIRPGILEVKSAILPKSKTFLEIIYLKRGVKNPGSRFLRANLGK